MKKLLLLFTAILFFSCSSDDDSSVSVLGPEEMFFEIQEEEYKVVHFELDFRGTYQVSYKLYNSELDVETMQPEKGELIEEGEFSVVDEYVFEKETGFAIFEYEVTELQEEGFFSIYINNELFFEDFTVDELNTGVPLIIPYKFDDSMIID